MGLLCACYRHVFIFFSGGYGTYMNMGLGNEVTRFCDQAKQRVVKVVFLSNAIF